MKPRFNMNLGFFLAEHNEAAPKVGSARSPGLAAMPPCEAGNNAAVLALHDLRVQSGHA